MMRSLETLPNVNIRDPSHDKNLPIMSNWVETKKLIFFSRKLENIFDILTSVKFIDKKFVYFKRVKNRSIAILNIFFM